MLRPARHRLPPLNTLRFFEAAARHGSFARAAAELCITAGAVSRQVKVLEESLGVALFYRHPQRLEIIRTGEMLLRTVQDAINSIERETRRIETDKNVVRIGLSPNFAVRWMSSRLHELKAGFPSLRLVIDASPELSDLSAGEVDFVIRFGNGYWDGAEAEPLFGGGLIAVGSGPLLIRYRASTGTIKKGLPSSMLRAPLTGTHGLKVLVQASGINAPTSSSVTPTLPLKQPSMARGRPWYIPHSLHVN